MKQPHTCKEQTCRKTFLRMRSTQEFCCGHCRDTYHNRIKCLKLKFADDKGFEELQPTNKEEWF